MVCFSSTVPTALILSILAGDITGHAVITRRLSKKAVAPANYSLRGASLPATAVDQEPLNEFDRMVVILEGVKSAPRKPETLTIEQRDGRFDPDLVVLPVGSTVQKRISPNKSSTTYFSLSHAHSFDPGVLSQGADAQREVRSRRDCTGVLPHPREYVCGDCGHLQPVVHETKRGRRLCMEQHFQRGIIRVTVWHKVAGHV